MKTITNAILLVALLLGFSGTLRGQQEVISLSDALRIALENNIRVQTERNQQEITQAAQWQSYLEYLPNLNLSAGGQRSSGRQFIQSEDRLVTQTTNSLRSSIGSSVTLFNGFGRLASLKGANFENRAQDALVVQTEQDIMYQVIQQYIQILFDQELLRIARENLIAQQDQLAQISELALLGLRSNTDLYRQQAEVARVEGNVIESENTLQIDKSLLLQTLLLDPLTEFEVAVPDTGSLLISIDTIAVSDLVGTAWKFRPDYLQRQLMTQASRQALRAARAGNWPSLSLSYGYGSNYIDVSPRTFEEQFLKDNVSSYTGVSLSVPVFNRMTTRMQTLRQQVNLRNAELREKELQQSIAVEVKQAYLQYQTSLRQQDVAAVQLRAAEQAFAAEQERYAVGASSFVDLSTANARYVEAAANQARARFMLVLRRYELEYAQGLLTPDLNLGSI